MGGEGAHTRCSVFARAEPLEGTAPQAVRWACLEYRGVWPRDINRHPDPLIAEFLARVTAAGLRPLLIRRPGRRGSVEGPLRLFFADTSPATARTTALVVTGPEALAAIPLPAAGGALPGERFEDPLLLVCTHGRRDVCCAVEGRSLANDVVAAGEPDVWECTHLGGHRFAPTALVLPTGYVYGRLDVATAIAARKSAGLGEVEPALLRGRSTWSAAGQVAEIAVRAATGQRDADALEITDHGAGDVLVRDLSRGRAWSVTVAADLHITRPASCGVGAVRGEVLRAAGIRPLPFTAGEDPAVPTLH